MTLKNTALSLGIAFVALAGSAAAASAATAYATDNVNVRSGPGGSYGVVDTLRRGERVDIDSCRGTWCLVYGGGVDGWVAASYLGNSGGSVGYVRPAPSVGISIGVGNGFYDGPRRGYGPRRDWDGPRHRGYDGPRYGGWDRPSGGVSFSFSN